MTAREYSTHDDERGAVNVACANNLRRYGEYAVVDANKQPGMTAKYHGDGCWKLDDSSRLSFFRVHANKSSAVNSQDSIKR